MKLYEFEAKNFFREFGIKVPVGRLISSPDELLEAIKELGLPLTLKAQVLAGGRGKRGGVKVVREKGEAFETFKRIKALNFGDERVNNILAEVYIEHKEELYLSIALNRSENHYMLIASKEGGVDVENLKSKIVRSEILGRFDSRIGKQVGEALGIEEPLLKEFSLIVERISKLTERLEAELIEINPLVIKDGEFFALDAKIIVDDNSLFRKEELSKLRKLEGIEEESKKYGFSYVKLDGNIGVIGNGAGLVLASIDLVNDFGLKPACFLDLGGGASKDRVFAALNLANSLPFTKAIFMNIFGGITNCVEVAQALIDLTKREKIKPLYLRLSGSGSDEALALLKNYKINIEVFNRAEDALERMVKEMERWA
ncbi:MAG: ATP-grasp domain-containing protein [Nitrososphaerales archaeon]